MKLSGNSRNGKHIDTTRQIQEYYGVPREKKAEKPKNTGVRIIIAVVCIIVALAAAGYVLIKVGIKPPSINALKRSRHTVADQMEELDGDSQAPEEVLDDRNGSKYTFLCLGMDDGNGNTDTIMVATLDTDNYTFNVVNIPRDTLVNVPWDFKKANTLYSYTDIDTAIEYLADILGYEVDHYAIIDLDAFAELVDGVGGIYYDVPVDMDYDDPYQDLYIHVAAGEQWLDGQTALGVCRYRYGYADADIGRISTQQDFLKTAISQILANKDDLKITSLVKIITQDVDTDLSYGNLAWFAKEFLKIDSENVTFTTLPANYNDSVDGVSFVTIRVDEWLEVLNSKLNPFSTPITVEELSILARDENGYLYSTNGVYAGDPGWGGGSYYYEDDYEDPDDYDDDPIEYDPEPSEDPEPEDETDDPDENVEDDPTEEEPTEEPTEDPTEDPEDEPADDPPEEQTDEPTDEPSEDAPDGDD